MKVKKLVQGLSDALDLDKNKKKKTALRQILAKMKKKEIALKKELSSASGKKKKDIEAHLKVNHAHRKKGVKALRKLKGKS